MAGISFLDPSAPSPAVTPATYQKVVVEKGTAISPFLSVRIHGSNGSSSSYFVSQPGNDPAYPADVSWVARDVQRQLVGRGIPIVNHDFAGVDPVTNLFDPNQFGSKAVMDSIDRCRTKFAPMFGLRSDLIGLMGESQGTEDCWHYLLQWPERVAFMVLTYPGCPDLELARVDPSVPGQARRVSVNRAWLGAGHDTETFTTRLAVDPVTHVAPGPNLTSRAGWKNSTAYVVNDVVIDPGFSSGAPANAYGGYGYRVVTAHTSAAAPAAFNPADARLTPLDPLSIHYTTPAEGGKSIPHPSSSPLSGIPATLLEPSNIARVRTILDGTLPVLNGRKVPVWAYYSLGDNVANVLPTNGVYPGAAWFFGQVGVAATVISPRAGEPYGANHNADLGSTGAPQPMDPAHAVTVSLSANGSRATARAANNQEVLIHVNESWGGGSLAFESSADGGVTWVASSAGPTVPVLADSTTEGAAVATTSQPGWYRWRGTGMAGVRKVSGSTAQVTIGVPYEPGEQFKVLLEDWMDDIVGKVLRVNA